MRYSIINYTDCTLVSNSIVRSQVKISRYGEGEVLLIEHFYKDTNGDFTIKGDQWIHFYKEVKDTNGRKTIGYRSSSPNNYSKHIFAEDSLFYVKKDIGISGSTGMGGATYTEGRWKKLK